MNWSQCVFGTNTVSVGTGMVVLCPVVYSASVKPLPFDTAQRTSVICKKAVNTQQISKRVLSVNMLRLKLGLCRIRRPCTPFLPLSTCPSIFYKHGQGFFFSINLKLLFPQYLSLMLQYLESKYPFMQQYVNFITLTV